MKNFLHIQSTDKDTTINLNISCFNKKYTEKFLYENLFLCNIQFSFV